MKYYIRLILMLICTFLLVRPFSVMASERADDFPSDKQVIFDNFDFAVSKECSSHDCFYKVSACEDGRFLVMSWYTDIKQNRDMVYKLSYIDLYTADGVFECELSFYTEQDFAVELTEKAVNLYFSDRFISYDLHTGELGGQYIQPGGYEQNGVLDRLNKTSFSCGKWQYESTRGFHGYTQLIRSDGDHTEILISLPGNGFSIWNTLIPAVLMCAGGIVTIRYLKKRKKA